MISALRWLSIPLLVLTFTTGLVFWAFPENSSAVRSTGVVMGWIGCGLLLSSLLLMVREPRLANSLGGLERQYKWHHWTGFAGYLVLLAHPLALAIDAEPNGQLAWKIISPFGKNWPVWAGWLSLVLLMAGLAATFERRLTYRARRYLHGCLGAGVLFGMTHLMLLGVDEPVEFLIVLAVLLLTWRAARDDWGLGARPYVVRSSRPIAHGTIEIILAPLADPIEVQPGQFVQVAFFAGPSFHGCGEFHPFTVCGTDVNGLIHIAVKAAGDCTSAIQSVKSGTAARIEGAFGVLFANKRSGPALWVAGGVGVAPFVSMLRSGRLAAPTLLLYLYRSTAEAAFLPELQAFARSDPKFSLRAIATGNAAPDLATILPDANWLADRECYAAGPAALIESVSCMLCRRGVTQDRMHSENLQGRVCDAASVFCCHILVLDRPRLDLGKQYQSTGCGPGLWPIAGTNFYRSRTGAARSC